MSGTTIPWSPRSSGPEEFHGKMVTLEWGLAQFGELDIIMGDETVYPFCCG